MYAKVKVIKYNYLDGSVVVKYAAPHSDIYIDRHLAKNTSSIVIEDDYEEVFFIVKQKDGTYKHFDTADDVIDNAKDSNSLPLVALIKDPINIWAWSTFYTYNETAERV